MPDAPDYLWITNAADWLFGWLLFLPRDLTLVGVAILMAAAWVVARKWTTDQEWLHRAVIDRRRLTQLRREARERGDTEAAERHHSVITQIRHLAYRRFAGRAFLAALLPAALLTIWGSDRLLYVPPRTREPVELRAILPHAAIGQMAHLAPEPGLGVTDGWIQRVVEHRPVAPSCAWDRLGMWIGRVFRTPGSRAATAAAEQPGMVIWHVVAHDTEPHLLQLRYAGRTYSIPYRAGKRQYEQPTRLFENAPLQSIEVVLTPRRLFNLVGGFDFLRLPPWLVVCLILVLPLIRLLRTIFRIV
ncbi:MAG: hypothetical protein WCR06_05815 [bacterium]